jgi:TolB-like protein
MASVWGELKRRNVVKVAVAYAIVGWLLVQIADTFFPALQLPGWTVTFVAGLVILGFPLALILSWAYELTPDGMKRSHDVEATESIAQTTGRKIDFAIIGALVLALGFVVVDNYLLDQTQTISTSTVDRRSIAALPFSNESAEEENAEFFANGIHDELLTQLAKIGSLKVISRTSVMEYRDRTMNMREIGEELGVATILEGRVQRAGDMVRINVQLIDAQTDEHIWAEIYNVEVTAENIFAIQSEMATSIAEALQATLLPEEVDRLNEVPTDSTRAYNFYLSGNDYFHRPDDTVFMRTAVEQYERAVDADPEFALAWAALSRAHGLMHWYALDPSESRLVTARNAVDRAFELEPDLPEAHLALGQHYYHGFRDYDSALAEFELAERGMPGASELFEVRAYVYRRINERELSITSMDRAIELDPRNIDLLQQQASTFIGVLDYTRGEQYLQRVLDIVPDNVIANTSRAQIPIWRDGDTGPAKLAAANSQPSTRSLLMGWQAAFYERDYATALAYLDEWDMAVDARNSRYIPKASYYGVTYQLAGRTELATSQFRAAQAQLEEALESSPDDARLVVSLAEAVAALGDREAGIRLARRAMELMPNELDANVGPLIRLDAITRVFAPAGDRDAVIEEFAAYLAEPQWWSLNGILPDPRLDSVRDDPRFQALVEEYSP